MYKIPHQIGAFVMPLIVRHDDSLKSQVNTQPDCDKYEYLFIVR